MLDDISISITSAVNGDRVVAFKGMEYLIRPEQVETRLEALELIQKALESLVSDEYAARGRGCQFHNTSPCCVCDRLYGKPKETGGKDDGK